MDRLGKLIFTLIFWSVNALAYGDLPYQRPIPKSEFERKAIEASNCNEIMTGQTAIRKKIGVMMLDWFWNFKTLPPEFTPKEIDRYAFQEVAEDSRLLNSTKLSFFLYQDQKIKDYVWNVFWDPVSYQSDLALQHLKAPHAIRITDQFLQTLSPSEQEWILLMRETLRLMEGRLVIAIERQEIAKLDLQKHVEDLLRYRKVLKMLTGEEEITTLWPYFQVFGPGTEVLNHALGGKLTYSKMNGQPAYKIHFNREMSQDEMSKVASSVMMLATHANKIASLGEAALGHALKEVYATTVTVADTRREFSLHHLNIKTLNDAIKAGKKVDRRFQNAPEDLIAYVKTHYAGNKSYTETQIANQENFSRTYADHLEYLFITTESADLEHFKIEGTFGIMTSDSPDLPLSDEKIYGINPVSRTHGNIIGNMIRFGLNPAFRGHMAKALFEVSSYLLNIRHIDLQILITHEDYALQLIGTFGFKIYQKVVTASGETLWELQIRPSDYIRASLNNITGGESLNIKQQIHRPSFLLKKNTRIPWGAFYNDGYMSDDGQNQ